VIVILRMLDNRFFSIEKCDARNARRIIFWTAGIIAAGILLTAYSPLEYLFHRLGYEDSNGCPLLTLAGFPCPLCGMGRSFWALLSLDFKRAVYYNPSGILFFVVSGTVLTGILVLAISGYRVKMKEGLLKLWYVFAGLILLMWVLNLVWGHH
jgi:uncharacterized protein DUF2752